MQCAVDFAAPKVDLGDKWRREMEKSGASAEQFRCQICNNFSLTSSFLRIYLDSCSTNSYTDFASPWGHPKMMDYKISDKVVYPNHGVGIVEQINYGVLNGRTERYYMIRVVSSGLRVMVPQSNAITVGLRSVIRNTESTKVLGFLEK